MKKIKKFENEILLLPDSRGIFCLIIDTYKEKQIWKNLFGHGSFSKMCNVENIPMINDANFLDVLKDYIECFIDGLSKVSDFESQINFNRVNLICSDLMNTRFLIQN